MTAFADLAQQSAAIGWLFIPSAVLLGALHGLEPGHSKTMMAAFIVAIRGTIPQAALLAVTATISHTAIVWLVAIIGLTYGERWSAETTTPYFQVASAAIIVAVALWMLARTYNDQQTARAAANHGHAHNGAKMIDTGHGFASLAIGANGTSARFRLAFTDSAGRVQPPPEAGDVTVETRRDDGTRHQYAFRRHGDVLEATSDLPEPHRFTATLSIRHHGHAHAYETHFAESGHRHAPAALGDTDEPDAHARAHADAIRARFANRNVTTGQIALFGLTGGLLPCPAAVTVLLLCLQLQQFWLGIVLVLCFSVGLALTLLASGTIAAWGMHRAARQWPGFAMLARRLPYVSSAIVMAIGLFVGYQGWGSLT